MTSISHGPLSVKEYFENSQIQLCFMNAVKYHYINIYQNINIYKCSKIS